MRKSLTGDQDYDLWVLLRNTTDTILRVRFKELGQLGVLGRQAALLLIIRLIEREGGKATPAEISRWLFREPHTISETLNRMGKDGLIKKIKDLDRKNLVRVVITEKGQQYYEKSTRRQSIHKMLSCLTREERQQLRSVLEKLRGGGLKELGIEQKIPWP